MPYQIVTHFATEGSTFVHYQTGCGMLTGKSGLVLSTTSNPVYVSCKKCKKSAAYRRALQLKSKQEA